MTAQPPPGPRAGANRTRSRQRPGGGVGSGHYPWDVDLTYPKEAEEFRSVIVEWLRENLPEGWGEEGFSMTRDERLAWSDEWAKRLHAGGWICASWPEEYGGKGLSLLEQVVLQEEFARVEAPLRAAFFGDTLVGPTLLQWGTEEQKQEFIPGILSGTISWCQGFSEP